MNVSSIIKVTDLKKSFKAGIFYTSVLRGVNLEICEGEFSIILGPSGSGKSTLLNTILGLEKPNSGKVYISSVDVYNLNNAKITDLRRRNFGVVYQQANWIKSLNVRENVAFPLLISGASEKKAMEEAGKRLEMINMYRFAKNSPTELSGGQQQKVSLARSLITNPEIILGDEPTGNLDTKSGEEIMNILKALSEYKKKTVLVVTHNPLYKKYGDKIIEIENGLVKVTKVRTKKAQLEAKKGQDLLNFDKKDFLV